MKISRNLREAKPGWFLVGNEGMKYLFKSLEGYIEGPNSLLPYEEPPRLTLKRAYSGAVPKASGRG